MGKACSQVPGMGKPWGISKWLIMMTNWPKKIKIHDILGGY